MAAHEAAKDVEGRLMAEQAIPTLASHSANASTSLSQSPTVNGDDHHLEKTATHSTHAHTDTAGEKVEKDVDGTAPEEESGLLSGARLYLVFLSLMLAVLVSPSMAYLPYVLLPSSFPPHSSLLHSEYTCS
jgi:hypothetical protein